tara:strand:- start:767 stop:1363 length:597 start_codon:yes stop_codon:yes gene_type:complete
VKKLKLILFFSLIVTAVFSQSRRDSVYFKAENYEGIYSEVKEQPIWIKYKVKNCYYGYSRKGIEFYGTDSIWTSNNGDYYKNVWDRGHMVPAASQNCSKKMITQTFSFLNVALQHQDLNRKTWRYLEEWERELANSNDVEVEIDVEFKTNQILKTGATIPSGFYKTIYLKGSRNLTFSFYFPNTRPSSLNYKDYQIKD